MAEEIKEYERHLLEEAQKAVLYSKARKRERMLKSYRDKYHQTFDNDPEAKALLNEYYRKKHMEQRARVLVDKEQLDYYKEENKLLKKLLKQYEEEIMELTREKSDMLKTH